MVEEYSSKEMNLKTGYFIIRINQMMSLKNKPRNIPQINALNIKSMNFSILNGMLSTVGSLVDKLSTNSKDKEAIKKEIFAAIMNNLNQYINAERDVIIAEAKGNWLQRSWRPIVMLSFSAIVILGIFIDLPILANESPFWDILQIGLGGYVIGRSAEKNT